jgi:hypothetical protein
MKKRRKQSNVVTCWYLFMKRYLGSKPALFWLKEMGQFDFSMQRGEITIGLEDLPLV